MVLYRPVGLRELELIQHFRPKFNVQGQPGYQKYHYLCVGKSPAPYVYAAARPTGIGRRLDRCIST